MNIYVYMYMCSPKPPHPKFKIDTQKDALVEKEVHIYTDFPKCHFGYTVYFRQEWCIVFTYFYHGV